MNTELTLEQAALAWAQGKRVECLTVNQTEYLPVSRVGTSDGIISPTCFGERDEDRIRYKFRLAPEPPAVGTAAWANSLPEGTKLTLRIGDGGWAIDRFTQKRNGVWSKWHKVSFTPDDGPKTGWELYQEPPAKKFRPWTPKEVPVGLAVIRKKDTAGHSLILGNGALDHSGVSFVSNENTIARVHYLTVFHFYEHSLDNGTTWLPCGVEVSE